jgi:hypothetical protein
LMGDESNECAREDTLPLKTSESSGAVTVLDFQS